MGWTYHLEVVEDIGGNLRVERDQWVLLGDLDVGVNDASFGRIVVRLVGPLTEFRRVLPDP